MSDERPDEFFSWRSRLGPPDALPEQGLDNRDLTWEKLTRRLGKTPGQDSAAHPSGNHASTRSSFAWLQPSRRRLPAYRIAAACLLLLLIPAARLFHNHQTQTPHQHQSGAVASHPPEQSGTVASRPSDSGLPAADPRSAGPSTSLIPQPTEITPLLQSGPTPKELARLQSINNKTGPAKAAANNRSLQNQSAKPGQPAKPMDLPSSPANTSVIPDSPVLISGLTRSPEPSPVLPQNTLKSKQLRIVHVNELDNSPNPASATTSIRSREPDIRVLILLKNH